MPTEPVVLPVYCVHCGGPITLQFEDWWPDNAIVRNTYDCPYCHRENNAGCPGRIAWMTSGHEEEHRKH
jgi:hypothetical protein